MPVQVTPYNPVSLTDLALNKRNFNAQQEQQGIRNQQANRQLDQGDQRIKLTEAQIDAAAKKAGMDGQKYRAGLMVELAAKTPDAQSAAAASQVMGLDIPVEAFSQFPQEMYGTEARDRALRETNSVPSGVREFNALTERANLDDAGTARAAQIALGTAPRAVGNSNISITNGSAGVTAADVGQTVGTIAGSEDAAKAAVDLANDIYTKQIPALRKQLANYDQAIDALDNGASSGAISNLFPSFRASTIELENATNKLGLDVIGMVTFGALSKGELDLALSVAVPRNLPEAELKQYLIEKKTAQEKYATELATMGRYLSAPGRTLNDYLTMMEQAGEIEYENEPAQGDSSQPRRIRLDAQGNIVQ